MGTYFANALIFSLFVVVWAAIQRRARQPYLRWWIAAYALFTLYYMLAVLRDVRVVPPWVRHLDSLIELLAAVLLVVGIYRFIGRRVARWVFGAVSLPLLYLVLGPLLGWPDQWRAVILYLTLAAIVAAVGFNILTAAPRGFGRNVTVVGFWGLAVWAALLPFVGHAPAFNRIEPHGDLLLILTISIGVVLMHFERAHDEQRRVAEQYASLFTSAPVGLFRIDDSGRLIDLNPSLCSILGASSADELIALEALAQDAGAQARLGALIEGRRDVRGEEVMLSGAEGPVRALLDLRWRRDEAGRMWADGVLQDVTAEYALRERIERGRRIEALGRMAGGIAHDFNNILTVVLSSLDLARLRGCDTSQRADVERATEAAKRAAALTAKLLRFARQPEHERRVVDLQAAVEAEVELLARTLGDNVTLDLARCSTPLRVHADAGELSQIVINLVFNARDAMPAGGTITLCLAEAELADKPAARLSVSDTGQGMDERTRARIFDPFFTTKRLGAGTGLGLATVYGIVEALGGEITVESSPGAGARFEIVLPLAQEQADPPAPRPPAEVARQVGRIIVVEDDPAVRALTERILRAAGHQVQSVASAEEALRLLDGKTADILLTDVVLPEISGPQLAAKVRSKVGHIVYMSGYTEDIVSPQDLEGATFVAKPFTAEQLQEAIDAVLADTPQN